LVLDRYGIAGHIPLDCLSADRRPKIEEKIKKAQTEDCFVDSLLFTLFSDKRTIIMTSPLFVAEKDLFGIEFKNILHLRNRLAHANDYAASPETAADTCRTVRMIDKWSSRLSVFANNWHKLNTPA